MTDDDFRARIYERYRTGCATPTPEEASAARASLEARGHSLKRVVRRHLPAARDAKILDLGCGDGALVHFARAAGYTDVSGVDRSPEQIEAARRLGIAGITQGDLFETLRALPDASHDVLVAFDVIEHLRPDELLAFVDHVRRALRPGGRCVVHVPNAESPFFGRVRYGDLTHERAFTRTSLGQLFDAAGFASVECFEETPVVHGAASAARYAVWKAVRAALRVYLAAETGSRDPRAVFSQNLLAVAMR